MTRWQDQLDDELGEAIFNQASDTPPRSASDSHHNKVWCPTKPYIAELLARVLKSNDQLVDGMPVTIQAPIALGSTRRLAKIVSRRLTELTIAKYKDELRSSGEIRSELFVESAEKQLAASMARHATDILGYIATCANNNAGSEADVVIEMQTVDQTLAGRETRGSGLVVCERGLELVYSVVDAILDGMDRHGKATTEPEEVGASGGETSDDSSI